jgi:transposase
VSELPPVPAGSSVGQLWTLVCELRRDNASLREVIEVQNARIEALERQVSKDSSTSSKPPSSDSLYRTPVRRSSRKSSGRRPGKQPGDAGTTLGLVDNPDEVITCDPGCCGECGADLSGAPVVGVQHRQIVEVTPPSALRVTEYRIVSRACVACGATASATAPAGVCARVQYGSGVLARAAELVCAHYLPVARAARLLRSMAGVPVSVGFTASVRGRAARMLEQTFLPRVRVLLRQAGLLHVPGQRRRPTSGTPHLIRERPMRDGVTLRRTISGVIRCRASERSPRDVSTAWTPW